jgi:hypothetical protein
VLEVDPDNSTARKQIAQVVTAVRQFDSVMPGRRWANNLPPHLPKTPRPWWHWAVFVSSILAAFLIGFFVAHIEPEVEQDPPQHPVPRKDNQLGPA